MIQRFIQSSAEEWSLSVRQIKGTVQISKDDAYSLIRDPLMRVVEVKKKLVLSCNFPPQLQVMQRDLQRLQSAGMFKGERIKSTQMRSLLSTTTLLLSPMLKNFLI